MAEIELKLGSPYPKLGGSIENIKTDESNQ